MHFNVRLLCHHPCSMKFVMNFENIVIFLPNDNRVLNFVPNVINLYTFILGKSTNRPEVSFKAMLFRFPYYTIQLVIILYHLNYQHFTAFSVSDFLNSYLLILCLSTGLVNKLRLVNFVCCYCGNKLNDMKNRDNVLLSIWCSGITRF